MPSYGAGGGEPTAVDVGRRGRDSAPRGGRMQSAVVGRPIRSGASAALAVGLVDATLRRGCSRIGPCSGRIRGARLQPCHAVDVGRRGRDSAPRGGRMQSAVVGRPIRSGASAALAVGLVDATLRRGCSRIGPCSGRIRGARLQPCHAGLKACATSAAPPVRSPKWCLTSQPAPIHGMLERAWPLSQTSSADSRTGTPRRA